MRFRLYVNGSLDYEGSSIIVLIRTLIMINPVDKDVEIYQQKRTDGNWFLMDGVKWSVIRCQANLNK